MVYYCLCFGRLIIVVIIQNVAVIYPRYTNNMDYRVRIETKSYVTVII